MNFIGVIILLVIIFLGTSHGSDELLKLNQNSHRDTRIRRNVISNGVLVSAARPVSTFVDKVGTKLFRSAGVPNNSSIFCTNDTDCTHISSTNVCLYHPGIFTGICLPKPNENIATSTINVKNIIYAIIASGLVLVIN